MLYDKNLQKKWASTVALGRVSVITLCEKRGGADSGASYTHNRTLKFGLCVQEAVLSAPPRNKNNNTFSSKLIEYTQLMVALSAHKRNVAHC